MVQTSKLSKYIFLIFSELLLIIIILIGLPLVNKLSLTNAYVYGPQSIDQEAVPPPVVPCLDEPFNGDPGYRDPEFHSLRPYQASPCGDSPKAVFCNNDYKIIEDVSMRWDPNRCDVVGDSYICIPPPNTTIVQPGGRTAGAFIIGGPDGRDYEITLSKAQYPFLGNTEDVFNSQSAVDTFDQTVKMTEYVNWYLQGVTEKAEYGTSYPVKNRDIPRSYFVTFGGPTKKLLPFDQLNLRRLNVLHDAGVKPELDVDLTEYQGRMDLVVIDPTTGKATTRQTLNHNQIAVCYLRRIPLPCYKGDGSKSLFNHIRLTQWWESRGSTPTQTFFGWTINNVWGGTTPPFPWQFDDPYLYNKAFAEWTGKTCIVIPLTNKYSCVQGPRSLGSELYEFVPLGNANDKNAKHIVTGLQVRAPGLTETVLMGYELQNEPVLHYPHTESTVQVSKLLNEINTPLECEERPEEERDPREGGACCNDGFTYSNVGADMCVNDKVAEVCAAFAVSLCTATNANPAIPGDPCNVTSVAQGCRIQFTSNISLEENITTICSNVITGIPIISSFASLLIPLCQPLVEIAFEPLEEVKDTLTHEPLCGEGLSCSAGVCKAPIPALNCSRLDGRGTDYEPTTCEFVDVRTNKGDTLTFKRPPSYLFVEDVKIRVEQIECQNQGELDTFHRSTSDDGCGGQTWDVCATEKCNPINCGGICGSLPGSCTSWPSCDAEVTVTIPSVPKIPNVDQIWQNTVTNNNTSFRRIFPKLEEGAPVECIQEIPGYTGVTYITNPETNLVEISTAGPNSYSGGGPSSQSQGQLFFPHLGTVYEYFLQGIQTALRPQGFGKKMTAVDSDGKLIVNPDGTPKYFSVPQGDPEKCAATGELGPCRQWLFEQAENGQYYYDKVIQAAASTTCSQGSLNPFWAIAIALNENGGLMSEAANGESNTHFGCRLSEVETIEEKITCMTATLRNDCGKPVETILQEYGYPAGYQMWPLSVLMGGVANPPYPPMFGSGFNVGQLVANLLSTDWYLAYQAVAPIFCPNSGQLSQGTTGGSER